MGIKIELIRNALVGVRRLPPGADEAGINQAQRREKMDPMTNRKFARENLAFITFCGRVLDREVMLKETGCKRLPPTKRQAGKFRRGVGNAFRFGM